jgi:hypothetical protein
MCVGRVVVGNVRARRPAVNQLHEAEGFDGEGARRGSERRCCEGMIVTRSIGKLGCPPERSAPLLIQRIAAKTRLLVGRCWN